MHILMDVLYKDMSQPVGLTVTQMTPLSFYRPGGPGLPVDFDEV